MRRPLLKILLVVLAGIGLSTGLAAGLSVNLVYLKLLKGESIPESWLEIARFLHPSSSRFYLAAAQEQINQGKDQEALQIMLEGTENANFDPQLHFLLGNLYAEMGSEPEAVEHWEKAGAWRYFQTLAAASEAESDIAGALDNYLISLSINASQPEVWAQAGRLYEKLGAGEQAAHAWGQAAIYYPAGSIERLWAEGENQRLSGRWADAVQTYRNGLALDPADTRFHIHLAYTYYYGYQDLPHALDEVERAISIRPDHFWYYIEMGNFLHFEGRYPEAETWFQQAVDHGEQGACEAMEYILDYYKQVRHGCAAYLK